MSRGRVNDLGPRYEDALGYAARIHRGQTRKGSDTPYLSHLLAVSALVIEDGGSEDEAIAALLHDAVEDQGGLERLEEIAQALRRRGRLHRREVQRLRRVREDGVAQRKERLPRRATRGALAGVHRVSVADKVHNLRSHRARLPDQQGIPLEHLQPRRAQNAKAQLWYYRSLCLTYKAAGQEGRPVRRARAPRARPRAARRARDAHRRRAA